MVPVTQRAQLGSSVSRGIRRAPGQKALVPASVLVLTRNEELNLPKCLASMAWCDDIVVLDSRSVDETQVIARSSGARVVERSFDNYANQRTFGLREIAYRHPWVLMVDADEEVPPELVAELAKKLPDCDPGIGLFRLRRKDHFLGKWIKHSSGYPTWFGRLVRPERAFVEREINEEYQTDGEVAFLDSHLIHHPFSKGFAAWFERHNRYSTMEANLLANQGLDRPSISAVLNADPTVRRKALKSAAYRLPFRPVGVFLGLYLFRGGFLEGRAGLMFCLLRSYYELMINCKLREIRRRERGLGI
ncbi:MAG: glycosyltransferase family 2 protein [Acidobacteriota bacterium]